uniref:Uncharacterized protein n=1 Tax=Picea sitchensis TaxID=3332 RepID=A9P124_PICSI|nr:unknown [Picea sitchensis]
MAFIRLSYFIEMIDAIIDLSVRFIGSMKSNSPAPSLVLSFIIVFTVLQIQWKCFSGKRSNGGNCFYCFADPMEAFFFLEEIQCKLFFFLEEIQWKVEN